MVLRLSEHVQDVVKRNCRQEIYHESTSHVVILDNLEILDFITCNRVIKCRSELNEDVTGENDIDQSVEDQEVDALHDNGVKTKLKWNTKGIIEGEDNNKQLPLSLSWVILTDHERLLLVK